MIDVCIKTGEEVDHLGLLFLTSRNHRSNIRFNNSKDTNTIVFDIRSLS